MARRISHLPQCLKNDIMLIYAQVDCQVKDFLIDTIQYIDWLVTANHQDNYLPCAIEDVIAKILSIDNVVVSTSIVGANLLIAYNSVRDEKVALKLKKRIDILRAAVKEKEFSKSLESLKLLILTQSFNWLLSNNKDAVFYLIKHIDELSEKVGIDLKETSITQVIQHLVNETSNTDKKTVKEAIKAKRNYDIASMIDKLKVTLPSYNELSDAQEVEREEENAHAEINMAKRLCKEKTEKAYIGVSLLCCPLCFTYLQMFMSDKSFMVRGVHRKVCPWKFPVSDIDNFGRMLSGNTNMQQRYNDFDEEKKSLLIRTIENIYAFVNTTAPIDGSSIHEEVKAKGFKLQSKHFDSHLNTPMQ
jgi:tRNA(Arg) A34 adenosine deaminase TadA